MSTLINLGLISLHKRFQEVDIILEEAKKNYEKNEFLYKALCRSAQVLLSAHFEGYLKDLVQNALEDINYYSSFKATNFEIKKTFCEYFIINTSGNKDSKEHFERIKTLVEVFEELDTKIKKEHFPYSENKNPKASILNSIAEKFGIKDFFKQIKKSNLDLVFSNTNADNIRLQEKTSKYVLESTTVYPYIIDISYLQINDEKDSKDDLWDAFLSNFLKRRHDIAHGKEIENIVGHSVIESDKVKIELLIYAFTSFICVKCNPRSLMESSQI